jgi:hypothetical protein
LAICLPNIDAAEPVNGHYKMEIAVAEPVSDYSLEEMPITRPVMWAF